MGPREKQLSTRVTIAFGMVYVLWGSTYLAIRVLVSHVSPLVMGSARFLAAGTIMLLICGCLGRKIMISGRDLAVLALIGILLLSGGNVTVGWAEQYLPSGLSALIVAVVPIWVAIIEAWLLRVERLSKTGIAGLALGTSGIILLLWPNLTAGSPLGRQQLIAAAGLVFASLSWSAGSVISRHVTVAADPFTATGWQMLMAGIFNTVLALAAGSYASAHWTHSAIGALAYLVTGGSLLGFTAYIWLLDNVPTAKVATYAYVNPVVAVFLGWLLLGERIDVYMLLGTVVIVGGVALVTVAKIKTSGSPKAVLASATRSTD